jgi:hypothetical protein
MKVAAGRSLPSRFSCANSVWRRQTSTRFGKPEEFNTGGGDKMPLATWLELIRNLESQQNFERAVAEYE